MLTSVLIIIFLFAVNIYLLTSFLNIKKQLETCELEKDFYYNTVVTQSCIIEKLETNRIDKEVLDAIKFAMKSAHPDNIGGSPEKFIKYRDLYNKLKENN